MNSAGYDIAILVNERLLNQLSGALYYNGFLTMNGSADFYEGTLKVKSSVMVYNEELGIDIRNKVSPDLKRFLKLAFRLKLTCEPNIDFLTDGRIRILAGVRIYFWLWGGLEIKLDSSISLCCPIMLDHATQELKADFSACDIEEFIIKYNGQMDKNLTFKLDNILEEALKAYFSRNVVSYELALPSLSENIPGIKVDPELESDKFNIFVKEIKPVSVTSLAVGINIYQDHGFGKVNELNEFVKNCSVGVAISEAAMHKVFNFYWSHLPDKSFKKDGWFKIDAIDSFFSTVSEIAGYIEKYATKALTLGFIESETKYLGMDFYYDIMVNFKNQPKFDLMGGNKLRIYNMSFSFFARLAAYCTVENKVVVDTSGWIPNSWTPWDDDIVVSKERSTFKLFDLGVLLDNLELRSGIGKVYYDEKAGAFKGKVEKIDLYWNFVKNDCPFLNLPEKLLNWILDQFEDNIAGKIPEFTLSPEFCLDAPFVPWDLKVAAKKIDISDSEATLGADVYFSELQKDVYPVTKYIANINNMEVHKISCDSVADIYEVHQRGYHLLNDAINAGMDGCKKCLPAYHTR